MYESKTLTRNTSAAVHRDFRQSRMSSPILAINVLCKSAIDVARGRRIALTSLVHRVITDCDVRRDADRQTDGRQISGRLDTSMGHQVQVARLLRPSALLPRFLVRAALLFYGSNQFPDGLVRWFACVQDVLAVRYANESEDVRRSVEPVTV